MAPVDRIRLTHWLNFFSPSRRCTLQNKIFSSGPLEDSNLSKSQSAGLFIRWGSEPSVRNFHHVSISRSIFLEQAFIRQKSEFTALRAGWAGLKTYKPRKTPIFRCNSWGSKVKRDPSTLTKLWRKEGDFVTALEIVGEKVRLVKEAS